jgi:hypothetical protein
VEHYALTVLKAEKSRLESELFEKEKFNESHFANKLAHEAKGSVQVYYMPLDLQKVRDRIAELSEAINFLMK